MGLPCYATLCRMTIDAGQGSVFPDWSLGDRIRKARVTVSMNQREFADAIKVKEGSLAAWETDRAQPRNVVAVSKRIEMLTRIPAGWILGLVEGRPTPPPMPPGLPNDPNADLLNTAAGSGLQPAGWLPDLERTAS